MILDPVFVIIFVNIGHHHREVAFHRGVVFVLGLHPDGVSRGVGFVVESGRRFEGTVGFEREEGIVCIPYSAHELVGKRRPGIRIGRIEFPHHRADRLVLDNGKRGDGVKTGGYMIGILLAPDGNLENNLPDL